MIPQVLIKRKENKLKQADVAKILHIDKQTYYLKENGKSEFTISEAKKLATYYDCSIDELFS